MSDVVQRAESNAASHWNDVSRALVAANRSSAPFAIRGYALVSLAQFNAAVAAEQGRIGNDHPSVSAAISAASVAVLSYLYPARIDALEADLATFLASPDWQGAVHQDAAMGASIGRSVAAQVVESARTDRFFAAGTIPVPTGPGIWFSTAAPVGTLWGQARTFFVTPSAATRPPAHPVFGSAEFDSAVAETRLFSANRTPAQAALAVFWDATAGTHTPPGIWNEEATRLAARYRLGELETAHVLALMNMVSYDAIVSSHEAKYFYWLLRPTMADPSITLAVPLPNFPSYPSNHATLSAGMARILADRFPAERARLDAMADQAALSRVFGGIHYRFDGEAGLQLGRDIAAIALKADVGRHEAFVLRY
jgi:hypothetical protein